MSVSFEFQEPSYFGPADVLSPTGEPEALVHGINGGVLKRQQYQDGTLYEVQVPLGGKFSARETVLGDVPEGVWHGVRETEDGRLLISIWAPSN